ncbi:MAG: hypothetical protein K6T90_01830 [Leptolyngbyaceae cyanobacterium HOT.MB2.61]|jgi:hypothetical protein|nr:hypothetical protein [Leptolyngbyaceae cyanobacterium HOT.MB2.61]
MTSRKLSESDKKKILELYRKTSETSSSLASMYGVSTSTVSRLLKSTLSEEEYESLIQQKRTGRFSEAAPASAELPVEQLGVVSVPVQEAPTPSGRRSRKRSSAIVEPPQLVEPEIHASPLSIEEIAPIAQEIVDEVIPVTQSADPDYTAEANVLQEMLGEDLLDQEEEDLDEDDLDDDLDEDDLDNDLEGALEEGALLMGTGGKTLVQVLPLEEASLPRTCYLVVDRSAELIARPLKDFGDLGQIPEAETQEKTLPIFDNHRVAKRYSNPRTQRVIKLPDGRVLQKTSSHLQAKGITRLLIDGQVYSLN